jgi:hypothetical protein
MSVSEFTLSTHSYFLLFFHAHFYGCFGVEAQEAFSVVMDEVKKTRIGLVLARGESTSQAHYFHI